MNESKCPKCGSSEYGPGPNFDNLRWIGCYLCGYGFKGDRERAIENHELATRTWRNKVEKLVCVIEELLPFTRMTTLHPPPVVVTSEALVREYRKKYPKPSAPQSPSDAATRA